VPVRRGKRLNAYPKSKALREAVHPPPESFCSSLPSSRSRSSTRPPIRLVSAWCSGPVLPFLRKSPSSIEVTLPPEETLACAKQRSGRHRHGTVANGHHFLRDNFLARGPASRSLRETIDRDPDSFPCNPILGTCLSFSAGTETLGQRRASGVPGVRAGIIRKRR
jgi:hypothetical protein